MTPSKHIAAIIVAAGNSSRLPGAVPKVYRTLQGKPVLEHSIEAFANHPAIRTVLVVANPEHAALYAELKEKWQTAMSQRKLLAQSSDSEAKHGGGDLVDKKFWVVRGGASRQDSVFNGLDALADTPPDWVLVHDAARPGVNAELIDRILAKLPDHAAVIPALPVKDTIKQATGELVDATLPREQLHAVQTPQGFHYPELLAAHIAVSGQQLTDDAAVMEAAGIPVALVKGDEACHKLTTPADWERAAPHSAETRVGSGYDVHQLIENEQRPLMICGVEIDSELALKGHSDADVGLHALVDALLGALGEGDIGEHFPPSDEKWKNADSQQFVAHAMTLLSDRGGQVVNADITLIAQVPKFSPHKTAMRQKVAELLCVEPSRVNVKATTTEGLGFTGREEGIAAQAVVMIALPS